MALYDNILPDSAKHKYSSNIYDNKVAGNRTNSRYSDSGASAVGGTVNSLAADLENNDGPMKGFTLETDDNAPTNSCKINTAGDEWGHLMDDDGKAIVTTKDAFCRTSYFSMDRGVQVFQGYDWYFPVVKSGYYGCIQCNADVGCANCFACYNQEFTGESCPSGCYGACTSGCTAGCTTGCTAACTASETAGCTEGCTTACTAACVSGCTTACTDCDGSEYTWENPETGEECEGCDSCTSCDSCDGCVGDEVSADTPDNPFHCDNCADNCFGCNAECNGCTSCTSCNGNVTQQECRNETSCTSACTAGCTTGCTANCTASCTSNVCGGCAGACQNNLNGLEPGCILLTSSTCNQGVTCDGGTISFWGGCKILVTCSNNNAEIPGTTRPCPNNVDYEQCKYLTGTWVACTGNCNTGAYSADSCDYLVSCKQYVDCPVFISSEGATDPTCDSCVKACTACDGSCNASCNGACTGCDACDGCVGCDAGCAACDGCTTGCFGSCTSGCAGGCTAGCALGCTACTGCASQTGCSGCTGGCTTSCASGCTTGCTSGCTGCDGCTTGCTSGCTGGCVAGATSSPCAGGCISCVGCIGGYV